MTQLKLFICVSCVSSCEPVESGQMKLWNGVDVFWASQMVTHSAARYATMPCVKNWIYGQYSYSTDMTNAKKHIKLVNSPQCRSSRADVADVYHALRWISGGEFVYRWGTHLSVWCKCNWDTRCSNNSNQPLMPNSKATKDGKRTCRDMSEPWNLCTRFTYYSVHTFYLLFFVMSIPSRTSRSLIWSMKHPLPNDSQTIAKLV